MNELIDMLVQQLGVSATQAEGGAAVLFKAARDKLGEGEFDKLLGRVPGLDHLMSKAPASGGGLGGLLGGLAGAVGGKAGLISTILQGFGKLGLTVDDARRFAPVIMNFLRSKAGPEVAAKLEQILRA
ncbi:MAG TPA: DUF2780 domain-containing protein [Steroidobacteraceae bacterium]|jgi:hypothetical protein|nr:DUF2780 domain-containing protein [Steroidobacteraceae bacterium]